MSDLHRTLPHAADAEMGVIGSMLNSRDAIVEAITHANDSYFYEPAHATIYSAIVSLHKSGTNVDLITFTNALRDAGMLEAVGGAAFVTSLFTFVPTAANVGFYLEIVRDKYVLRQIIGAGTEAVRRAYELGSDTNVQDLVDWSQKTFTEIALAMSERDSTLRAAAQTVPPVLEEIKAIYHSRGGTRGISTGFYALDRMSGGLKPGDVLTVAGRPAMGKTAFGMNIAEHVTLDLQLPVLVFSIEMSWAQLTQRLLLSRSHVSLQRLRDGFMKRDDLEKITEVAAKVEVAPLYIDDTSGLRLFELQARMRRAVASFDVRLVVIDYLQLMESGNPKRGQESRAQELSEIANGIKKMARELGIPVIMLAQVSRAAEQRPGAKPRLSDLKESGAIEEASDIVAFVYREEYYAKDADAAREVEGQATLIVAKHRNGPVGDVALTFVKEYTRFENPAGEKFVSNNEEERQRCVEPLARN